QEQEGGQHGPAPVRSTQRACARPRRPRRRAPPARRAGCDRRLRACPWRRRASRVRRRPALDVGDISVDGAAWLLAQQRRLDLGGPLGIQRVGHRVLLALVYKPPTFEHVKLVCKPRFICLAFFDIEPAIHRRFRFNRIALQLLAHFHKRNVFEHIKLFKHRLFCLPFLNIDHSIIALQLLALFIKPSFFERVDLLFKRRYVRLAFVAIKHTIYRRIRLDRIALQLLSKHDRVTFSILFECTIVFCSVVKHLRLLRVFVHFSGRNNIGIKLAVQSGIKWLVVAMVILFVVIIKLHILVLVLAGLVPFVRIVHGVLILHGVVLLFQLDYDGPFVLLFCSVVHVVVLVVRFHHPWLHHSGLERLQRGRR
ncbi:hypothetical protein HK405_005478, partial [Cladochytrium tenue]